MDAPTVLDRGRTAYSEHRWTDAINGLDAADRATAATALDLEQLATAALLVGRFEESVAWRTRAHEAFIAERDLDGAIRSAVWLGMEFMYVGNLAQAGGWFARAQRLLDCPPLPPATPRTPLHCSRARPSSRASRRMPTSSPSGSWASASRRSCSAVRRRVSRGSMR